MKKTILSLVLLITVLFGGCQSVSDKENENDITQTETTPEYERVDATEITFWDKGNNFYNNGEAGYRDWIKKHPLPEYFPKWDWFSSLGNFAGAQIWINIPEKNTYNKAYGFYEYEYVDPDTGETIYYSVKFVPLGEDSNYSLRDPKVRLQHVLVVPEESDLKEYNDTLFTDGDFSKYTGNDEFGLYLVNDQYMFSVSLDHYLNGYFCPGDFGCIYFIHDNIMYRLSRERKAGVSLRYDFSRDCEMFCRLAHIDTYKEAIEELMNPENAK